MTDLGADPPIEEIHKLLDHVLKSAYRARDNDINAEAMVYNCLKLFGKDYKFTTISNNNGELCSHYPTKIPVLEYECSNWGKLGEKVESLYDGAKLKDLVNKAKFARCRGRFAVPVILFEGKHICRGATISGGVEMYGRSGIDFFFSGGEATSANSGEESEWHLFNRVRGQDIRLLKTFSIGYICDLMVEKKKVKFGMNVTSSEKVDKENRYSDFNILAVPYPGCEFFKTWRDNGYMAEGLRFDWKQGFVDAQLDLPPRLSPPHQIEWQRYRSWDLVQLTQNYLQLLLHYVREADSGLLVHCISGWDRTPLFISLLRLSLWADGAVHPSLGPAEILYLTIAYDWYLYGHNFPDRLSKGEDIFFFCFNFLKYITADEFSVKHKRRSARTVSRTDSECLIDGVLLDPDTGKAGYRGSNTSINSTSSLNSTRSSVDNPPVFFMTEEDPSSVPNGSGRNTESSPVFFMASEDASTQYGNVGAMHTAYSTRVSPVNKHPPEPNRLNSSQQTSTSPMAVPSSIRRVSEVKNSPCYGSWQIITGTGSLKGSPCSHESLRSHLSDNSGSGCGSHTQGSCSSTSHQPHHHHSDLPPEESVRKQRLDATRRLFLTVYTSMVQFTRDTDGGGGGGISGLLDHFAEKVGFRSARGTPV